MCYRLHRAATQWRETMKYKVGGEWDTEADSLRFTHAGLDCLILRNMEMGHLCAYVRVPESHPMHNMDYIEAGYGALSFGSAMSSEGGYWFGMDFAHVDDLVPNVPFNGWNEKAVYRNMEYAKDEASRLAEWLNTKGEANA